MIEYYSVDQKCHSCYRDMHSYYIGGSYNAAMRLGLTGRIRQQYVWRFIGFKPW